MFGKTKKGKRKKLKLPDEGIKKFKKSKLDNLKELNKVTGNYNSSGEEENSQVETYYQEENLELDESDNFEKISSELTEDSIRELADQVHDEEAGEYNFESKNYKSDFESDNANNLEDQTIDNSKLENHIDDSYEIQLNLGFDKDDSNSEISYGNVDDNSKNDDEFEDHQSYDLDIEANKESKGIFYEDLDDESNFKQDDSLIISSNNDADRQSFVDDERDKKNKKIKGKSKSKLFLGKINKKPNTKKFNFIKSSFILFDRLMIRTRILLGFMSILLLISIVGIMVFSTIGSMIKSQIPIILNTENFKNKVFEMERVEKNFLLFEPSNIEFYKNGESKYIDEFKLGYEEALKSFEVVISSPIIKASGNTEEIESFRLMLEEYNSEFLKVTELIAVRGYGEYGKMGELKEASESLKKSVIASNSPELEAELYKVFLLESEYFRTNDETIFKKIPSASSTFRNLLNTVEISDEDKGKIRSGLINYNSKIQLVNSLNKSVYNDRFGAITKYREKGNTIIDQINTIYMNVSNSALGSLNTSRMSITTIILVSVGLTLFVAILITTTIVKPINDTKDLVKDIAEGEGDLTYAFDINGKNEMEEMKNSINIFVSKIRNIIIGVKGTSKTLSESSGELSKAIEEANIHIEEISNEVNNISKDLISTSDYVVEVNSSITDMTSSASSITSEAINVSSNSLEIIEAANRGSDLINDAASSIDEVKHSSETVNEAISELQVHSKEIGGIIDIIKGISDQTNLLALNASIEAARAGEHGRGFAVVANEVRNLSEETKKSTAKISDLIKKIELVVTRANTNIKNEQNKVTASVEQTHKAKNEFAVILNMIKDLSNKIEYIVSQSKSQNDITSEMARSITDILMKTEKNTESSSKISENIESQVSIFEEIGASLEELSAMADVLTGETDKFKV